MTGYIYALECGDQIKIGWSKNPKNRAAQISNERKSKWSLIAYRPGTKTEEASIHESLTDCGLGHETYRKDERISSFLATLPSAPAKNPLFSNTVLTRLRPDLKTQAEQRAREQNRSLANFIENILDEWLKANPTKEQPK